MSVAVEGGTELLPTRQNGQISGRTAWYDLEWVKLLVDG